MPGCQKRERLVRFERGSVQDLGPFLHCMERRFRADAGKNRLQGERAMTRSRLHFLLPPPDRAVPALGAATSISGVFDVACSGPDRAAPALGAATSISGVFDVACSGPDWAAPALGAATSISEVFDVA